MQKCIFEVLGTHLTYACGSQRWGLVIMKTATTIKNEKAQHLHQNMVLSDIQVFQVSPSSQVCKEHLTVVFSCISTMANKLSHLFMSLFSINVSLLANRLLKPLAHFLIDLLTYY